MFFSEAELTESFNSGFKAVTTLAGDVYDRPLDDFPVAIRPAKRDMHHYVERNETFPAFGRSPQNGKALARYDSLNQVAQTGIELDRVKRYWCEPGQWSFVKWRD
jgi:hypothetical protein